MTDFAPRPRYSLRWQASRDWPLAGGAISAVLSFAMLFPPWLTADGESENAFGDALQSGGPALIIVMALAVITLLGMAAATAGRRYLTAALVPSSNLLVIYVVKVADVSDLADLYSKLAASLPGASVGTGAGLWLGFVFALLTVLFVLLAMGLKWGTEDALVYPAALRTPREPHPGVPPDKSSSYPPPPPKDSPDTAHETGNE
ncbi:hypothetical protein FBY35_0183 [Streptomyces sp. SLBN-118]|uniref:hypothetical protein n=1 Tax=Streptomyces sp. SLBN-118 TaxID=2768454 RepID=UPI00114D569C|nr:hypothetical protein [Streptomyces sp. SLBN-118]TQK49898.1 hypothetical protein FBY35_0183 [Streptomyces sp. SLBN-118]